MPRCSRTIRNSSAKGILETLKVPVDNKAAYTVNGHFGSGETSSSGVALCIITKVKGRITDAEWIGAKEKDDSQDDSEDDLGGYYAVPSCPQEGTHEPF